MAKPFIAVGENIHCTRIYKVGGKYCKQLDDGSFAICYAAADGPGQLPVPEHFQQSAEWEAGKVKHCQVAIWQGVNGTDEGKAAGVAYIQYLAKKQAGEGATYLDVNIDEYSTDVAERVELIKWVIDIVQQAVDIPVSVDSSNMEILAAGLEAADASRGAPMVNSVSLERIDAIDVAISHNAVVIASAAGEKGLPETQEERMTNIENVVATLTDKGMSLSAIHVDPLVFPISTDSQNGVRFLEAVAAVREKYGPEIHIVAGLSNVSFGMPNRKLINQTFARLAVDAGADGGIVDPAQISGPILEALDTESEAFGLARDLLNGSDDFGMNYITASRDGRL